MDDEVFAVRRVAAHEVGEKLDDLSIADLDARLALLRREIERIEEARAAKQAALTAAGSIFRL